MHYFGQRPTGAESNGWKEAEEASGAVAADLHAVRSRAACGDGLVADPRSRFLTSKLRKMEAGELTSQLFEHKEGMNPCVSSFGASRLVDDLAADDFGALQATMARK